MTWSVKGLIADPFAKEPTTVLRGVRARYRDVISDSVLADLANTIPGRRSSGLFRCLTAAPRLAGVRPQVFNRFRPSTMSKVPERAPASISGASLSSTRTLCRARGSLDPPEDEVALVQGLAREEHLDAAA